jgi:O-antigen/teichoic acid export membrane protein
VVVVTTIAALVMWVTAGWAADLLFPDAGPVGVEVLQALALVLPAASLSMVAVGGSRGLGHLLPMVGIENIAKPVSRVLFCALVGLAGLGVLATTLAWAVPTVLGGLVAGWACQVHLRRAVRGLPGGTAVGWRESAARFWSFAGFRGIAATVDVLGLTIGLLVVSALAGSHEAGIFAGVTRWVVAGTLGLQAVRLVIAPQISGMLASRDITGAQHLHGVSTVGVLAFSGPFYAVLAVFAGPVLALLGPDFRQGTTAMVVLAAAMFVNVATGNVQTVLLMSGRSGTNLAVVLCCLGVNLGLSALLVPDHGVTGAAVAWAVAIVVENLSYLVVVRRDLGIRTITRGWLLVVALTGGCFAVPGGLAAVLTDGQLWPAAACLLGTVGYLWAVARRRSVLGLDELVRAARARGRRPDTDGQRPRWEPDDEAGVNP